jgi:hypothetical protein
MISQKKLNCWEFKSCGRVYGGIMDGKCGICPASTEKRLDGIHSGKNAGRTCWVISGTMCNDKVQGSFDFKFHKCAACDFYQLVKKVEGDGFVSPDMLLKKLTEH